MSAAALNGTARFNRSGLFKDAAMFHAVALYTWSRSRRLIMGAAAIYIVVLAGYAVPWTRENALFVSIASIFVSAAPFWLTLALLFTSTGSIVTTDLAGRESAYPRLFLRLPVTNAGLALPFMTYTAALVAGLWTVGVGVWTVRALLLGDAADAADTPIRQAASRGYWDPILLAALLVWLQALIWTPFRVRWIRVAYVLVAVGTHSAAAEFVDRSAEPGLAAVALGIVLVPLACLVGIRGIARTRRGEERRGEERRDAKHARQRNPASLARRWPYPLRRLRTPRRPFASGFVAQSWFESRLSRGRAAFISIFISGCVLLVVAFLMMVAAGSGSDPSDVSRVALPSITLLIWTLVVVSLTTGVSFAAFESGVDSYTNDGFRMPAFFAALPLSTGDFAWAKLRAAARRMALVAAILVATIAGIAVLTDVHESFGAVLGAFGERFGIVEAWTLAAAGVAAVLALAAAGSASVVWVRLLGRHWSAVNAVIVLISVAVIPLSIWINTSPNVLSIAAVVLPAAAAVKLGVLGLLAMRVQTHRLYERARVVAIGACWAGAVAVGFAAYLRYAPDGPVDALTALSGLVVIVPVLGILGAPLALRMNRSR